MKDDCEPRFIKKERRIIKDRKGAIRERDRRAAAKQKLRTL